MTGDAHTATRHGEALSPGRRRPRSTRPRVLVDGRGPVVDLFVSHLLGHGVRALHGAWAAEAAELVSPPAARLDVAVLVAGSPADPWRARTWVAGGIPHLPVEVSADLVVVGPLVDPGRSSCLMCHELTRHDHERLGHPGQADPRPGAWVVRPPQAARWVPDLGAGHPTPGSLAHGAPSLGLLASALAAALVLDVLSGDLSMAGISTDVTIPVPDLVHRHWPQHPLCGCARAGRTGHARPA